MLDAVTRFVRNFLMAVALVMLLIHWALPVIMPLDDGLLNLVGDNVNWIIVVTLVIAMACLAILVLPTLDKKGLLLVLAGVALDQGIGELVFRLDLPLYLDTIGSVLVGALLGPMAGAFTASLSCSLWIFIAPVGIPFSLASIVTGWMAGMVARLDGFSSWLTAAVSGIITGLAVGILSSPLTYVLDNSPIDRENFNLYGALAAVQDYFAIPFSLWTILTDPIDKLVIFMLAFVCAPKIARKFWSKEHSAPSGA